MSRAGRIARASRGALGALANATARGSRDVASTSRATSTRATGAIATRAAIADAASRRGAVRATARWRASERADAGWRAFARARGTTSATTSATTTTTTREATADALRGATSAMHHRNAFMVREREIRVFPGERGRVATSLSNVAGHVSFLLLGYSYLTSDLLTLRALAVGGLSAAVVFQYFREVPLWLPIRWNALFVAINVFWVAKLYYDEYNAEHWCTTEERSLYDRHFSHMALNSFRTLLKHGKWRDIERGFEFTKEGKMNENVHVLIDGSAEVYVGGKSINSIDAGSFIGEMSLMRSIAGSNAKKQSNRPRAASATVVAAERCRVFSWDDRELRQLIQQNEQIKSGVQAAFGVGLAEKLLTTRVMSTKVFTQEPQRVSHALA